MWTVDCRYIWDPMERTFFPLAGLDRGIRLATLHSHRPGLTETKVERLRLLYGRNEIAVPMENLLVLLVKEILTPFYVFQLFRYPERKQVLKRQSRCD